MTIAKLILFFFFAVFPPSTRSLSCLPCDPSRCNPRAVPGCCVSGVYAKDACGCCAVCPQEDGDVCGGPWNRNGTCAPGLVCAMRCPCMTRVRGRRKPCVFPFNYKGVRYNSCTTVHARYNRAWCATRVDPQGDVIPGEWGDCHPRDCPSETEPCYSGDDPAFREVGVCVTPTVRGWIETYYRRKAFYEGRRRRFDGRLGILFLPGLEREKAEKAPTCPECFCGSRCYPMLVPSSDRGASALGCRLSHVADVWHPRRACYSDAVWSPHEKAFVSIEACSKWTWKDYYDYYDDYRDKLEDYED